MKKFCINCKHVSETEAGNYFCLHPDTQPPQSLVTGEVPKLYCENARIKSASPICECGPAGNLFEAK
jgi:hypothetical protein